MSDLQPQILEYVIENRRVDVTELAAMLGMTQGAIRKDLDQLERDGLLRREHGLIVAAPEDNMLSRLSYHHDMKRSIARRAAESVADGETVMIESGSSCALLADTLTRTRRGVTIITNSAFIADFVRRNPYAKVVLLGGEYQVESQVVVGPLTVSSLKSFYVDKLFVGIDGYTEESGFTAKNLMRADVVRAMAAQAKELNVVTESLKFPRRGAVQLVPAGAVHTVFTDDRLPRPIQDHLTSSGVTVVKVPAGVPSTAAPSVAR